MPSLSLEKNAETSDRELVFTRLLDAPIGVVFDAWTNPVHLPHWWGPKGFTTTIEEMDVRPGGVWRLTMHGPDGRDYRNRIVFQEVEKPYRLVYRHEPEAGSEPVRAETTVTFTNDHGKTRVVLRMLFPSAAERDHVVNTYHAEEGFEQTLTRLIEHLGRMAEENRHLAIKRVLDAPRDLVFKAWIDAKHLAQWWGPKGFTNPLCEVDVRPGGKILIQMRSPEGVEYPVRGSFVEIVEPERLVFRLLVNEADESARFEVLNTATFVESGESETELTLEVRVMSAGERARGSLAGARMGWTQSLERLAMLIESKPGRPQ
jgi:uncharacterized protein YndB with AHSA1/START domain